MTRFTTGSILGFLVGISVAATQAPPKEDPCTGWKFDCAVLEAGILALCGGDMEKYANVLQNMGWSAARAVRRKMGQDVESATPQMYKFETETMNAIDRLQHNQVRDVVMQEAIIVLQEDAARKARNLSPKKGQAARLDA
jgi:hypothetical protein